MGHLAALVGVPLVCGGSDVRGLARRDHLSLEDAARRVRYAFLADAALGCGANVVATGHTSDDQAETVLLHLLRGAGLDGLGGMSPRAAWPFSGGQSLFLVRPLLALSRSDAAAYCAAAGIHAVDDPSNHSLRFGRNRVRHELLPKMREFNPRVSAALVRVADAAQIGRAHV